MKKPRNLALKFPLLRAATQTVNLGLLIERVACAAITAVQLYEGDGRTPEAAVGWLEQLRHDKDVRALRRFLR